MAIEYGYRTPDWVETWCGSRAAAERWAEAGCALIAREVSEPWVVSIRD